MSTPRLRQRIRLTALVTAVLALAVTLGLRAFRSPPFPEVARIAGAKSLERRDLTIGFTRTCPPERRPELLRQVAVLEGGEGLALLVLHTAMDADPFTADPVLDAYRERFPDDAFLPIWTFLLPLKQGRVDEAVRRYHEAARREANDEDRGYLRYQFLDRMADAGRELAAYHTTAPEDEAFAFETLAPRLEKRCDTFDPEGVRQLRTLIAEHTRQAAAGPQVAYYAGRADEGARDYENAQRNYAAGMAQMKAAGHVPLPKNPETKPEKLWTAMLRHRLDCLVALGRWEQAYAECRPTETVFVCLAEKLVSPQHAADLDQLIARHRQRYPTDREIPFWQAVGLWNRKEYAHALPLFEQLVPVRKAPRSPDTGPEAEPSGDDFPSAHRWDVESKRFLCLVRLGRFDEARAAAAEMKWRNGPLFFPMAEVILAAKAGNVAYLDDRFAELAGNSRDPFREWYEDEDLGPLLKADVFAGLRKKYPPPAPAKPEPPAAAAHDSH